MRNRALAEYYLNMVGAEILNRAYRSSFVAYAKQVVLVPACMCQSEHCQKTKEGPGYRCADCSQHCRVSELTRLGKNKYIDVYIVPHSSSVLYLRNNNSVKDAGVIGIACVLNLLAGGWMLREAGIEPQCVLLDFCGCKKHWHQQGVVTDINTEKLKAILQIM